MRDVQLRQVIVTHYLTWQRWPDTPSADFADVIAERSISTYARGDVRLHVETRRFPAYLAWHGHEMPPGYPGVNNVAPVPAEVVARQRDYMRELASECEVLLWDHARGLPPQVATELPHIFKLTLLDFADDCPGSSPMKTFPVAHGFHCVRHRMCVYDFASGARCVDEYKRHGARSTVFLPMLEAHGLLAWQQETAWSLDARIEALRGDLPIDLVWVGSVGPRAWTPHRGLFLDEMQARSGEFASAGIRVLLHGSGLTDGELPRTDVQGNGYALGPVYSRARFGFNVPCSSHYNSRFADLARCGVVMILHDRWGELAEHGFVAGEHYVPFDGTVLDLLATTSAWQSRRAEQARIARAMHVQFDVMAKACFLHAADPYLEAFA